MVAGDYVVQVGFVVQVEVEASARAPSPPSPPGRQFDLQPTYSNSK